MEQALWQRRSITPLMCSGKSLIWTGQASDNVIDWPIQNPSVAACCSRPKRRTLQSACVVFASSCYAATQKLFVWLRQCGCGSCSRMAV